MELTDELRKQKGSDCGRQASRNEIGSMRMVPGWTTSGRNGMGVGGDEGEWQVCNSKGAGYHRRF